ASFLVEKHGQALFFGPHAVALDSIQFAAAGAYHRLLGYPGTVQLFHVDRVGFDRVLFEKAVADDHCIYLEDRAAALDYDPVSDRIGAILLASGTVVVPTYVFDATNHVRFLARKLGVGYMRLG